jgi:hypothetical protein
MGVVICMSRTLVPLSRNLDGLQSQSGRFGEEKIFCSCRDLNVGLTELLTLHVSSCGTVPSNFDATIVYKFLNSDVRATCPIRVSCDFMQLIFTEGRNIWWLYCGN